jgi:Na+/H+ antiporter NhaD/arsenite permease-like protein
VVNFLEFMKFGAPLTIIQVLIYLMCIGFYHLFKLV